MKRLKVVSLEDKAYTERRDRLSFFVLQTIDSLHEFELNSPPNRTQIKLNISAHSL